MDNLSGGSGGVCEGDGGQVRLAWSPRDGSAQMLMGLIGLFQHLLQTDSGPTA